MRGGFIYLDVYGFVYERVMFITKNEIKYEILFGSKWESIKSTIEGVL